VCSSDLCKYADDYDVLGFEASHELPSPSNVLIVNNLSESREG